jgi:O-acetyl-ADP-ribose deacetylase
VGANIEQFKLKLILGDITEQDTEAIVNSANKSLLAGSGVCGAIHKKAGKELEEECMRIRQNQLNGQFLGTGSPVMTKGYGLKANYVIHTVGPHWFKEENPHQLLKDAYWNSLKVGYEAGIRTISFPSISTGIYGFPVAQAAEIAINTILEFLEQNEMKEVRIVLFNQQDYLIYSETRKQIHCLKFP